MFVRNAWYNAGWDHMFTQGKRSIVARQMAGERVVLYRKPDGQIAAMEDRCPHRQAALSLGQKEGDGLRCMYHGMRFGADGKCNEIPGQDTIPERACVRVYPVVEKDNWVWVWMGDKEKADPKLIPFAVTRESTEIPASSLNPSPAKTSGTSDGLVSTMFKPNCFAIL